MQKDTQMKTEYQKQAVYKPNPGFTIKTWKPINP